MTKKKKTKTKVRGKERWNDYQNGTDKKEYDDKKSSRDKRMKDEDKASSKRWNDASWYIPDEGLRKIVGSISYQTTLGVPTELDCASFGPGGVSVQSSSTSFEPLNVMSIETFPYPGTDVSATGSVVAGGPLTVGMRKLYAAIAALTGRGTNYTPEDLGFAILAIGEIVSAISFCQRLIGIIYTYNPRNRGIPKQLVQAMGVQYDSLNENITRFRDSLNLIITSANNIRMIKDIKYFTKCWELYAHIYKDSDSGMATFYVTKPAGFLQLSEVPDPDDPTKIETSLGFSTFAESGPVPYTTLLRKVEQLVNAVLTSTTLKDVYNDILNYVTKQGGDLLGFSYVPELYSILPEYNETFMNQVHNMNWGFTDLSNYVIYGDPLNTSLTTTNIWGTFSSEEAGRYSTGDQIIDQLFSDNPTADQTIDAVMFKSGIRDVLVDGSSVTPRAWTLPDHPVHSVKLFRATGSTITFSSNIIKTKPDRQNYTKLSAFRAVPIFYDISDADGANYIGRNPVANDLNYYTKIKYDKLKGIFDYAFMGLFDAEVKGVAPF